MPRRRPDPARILLVGAFAVAGVIFTLQGLGAPIGRSFMIGDLRWTAIGLVLVAGAAAYGWRELRRR